MSISTTNLFGRAWRLTVYTVIPSAQVPTPSATFPSKTQQIILSQDDWGTEALRVTFDILQSTLPSPYWYADITVYNLNDTSMQNLVQNAKWVTLEAGYQSGLQKSGIVWDGPVLQVLYGRQNVVDKTIRFNCVATTPILADSFINQSYGPAYSQAQAVSQMITKTGGNPDQQVSPFANSLLAAKTYLRGKTVFGQTSKYMQGIADDNRLSYFKSGGGRENITELMAPNADLTPLYVYSPPLPPGWKPGFVDGSVLSRGSTVSQSIIGVPTQSPFGVDFTVLLDPRVYVKVPPMVLGLDFTVIDQLKAQLGQLFTPLPKGAVLAGEVRYEGDTRGDAWYTHVKGFSPNWAMGLISGDFTANGSGGQ